MDYQLIQSEFSDINQCSPIERLFVTRGIAPENLNHYLHTSKEDLLDPILLDNIDIGATMFIEHLAKGDKIFIQIDADADGFTAAAALINYAYKLAPATTQNNIIFRIHEGKQHGIMANTVPDEVKLVIIPDAGSNDIEEHKKLYDRGIDVLILDHHEVEQPVEYACLINNQSCSYPNKSLSGVGIVYKFCVYIDRLINQEYADEILDLTATGIIADMMDLHNTETREILTLGLQKLHNPFLIDFAQKQEYSLKGNLTPMGVAFYIAPYINAVVRTGTQDEKLALFYSMLDFKGYELIPCTKRGSKDEFETRSEYACRMCANVKNRQKTICDKHQELIDRIIEEEHLLDDPVLIIQVADQTLNPNITGLLANQYMNLYKRPTIILRPEITTTNTGEIVEFKWLGSGRCPNTLNLNNFREFIANSGCVLFASGHAYAFGVSILDSKIEDLKTYIKSKLHLTDMITSYPVDFIWNSQFLDNYSDIILNIGNLSHIWGQGIDEPLVAVEDITITAENVSIMSPNRNPTLKITLPSGICILKFKFNEEDYQNLYTTTGAIKINIVGTCNANYYRGNCTPQIFIKDYEVINRLEYLF